MHTISKPQGSGMKNFNCPNCEQFRMIEYHYDRIVTCSNCNEKTKIEWI